MTLFFRKAWPTCESYINYKCQFGLESMLSKPSNKHNHAEESDLDNYLQKLEFIYNHPSLFNSFKTFVSFCLLNTPPGYLELALIKFGLKNLTPPFVISSFLRATLNTEVLINALNKVIEKNYHLEDFICYKSEFFNLLDKACQIKYKSFPGEWLVSSGLLALSEKIEYTKMKKALQLRLSHLPSCPA